MGAGQTQWPSSALKKFGVLLFTGLLLSAIWWAQAASGGTSLLKLNPAAISLSPDSSLPSSVQAQEQQTLRYLFDRDTTTEFTSYGNSRLELTFDRAVEIHQLKIYSAAPYALQVQVWVNHTWQNLAGLGSLDLSSLTPKWHSFTTSSPQTTDRLRIRFAASPGGTAGGLKELEVWGAGQRYTLNTGANLLAALSDTSQSGLNPPPQGKLYPATPAEGVIGDVPGRADSPADNVFTFQLDRDPATLKRAWLSYESHGAGHWISVTRQINANATLGGSYRFASSAWSGQLEPINPAWLQPGENRIAFTVPAEQSYRIRHLQLLAEFEDGSNFVDSLSAAPASSSNTALAAHDGDSSSGWRPYGMVSVKDRYLELKFDKPTQLDGLALQLSGSLKGKIETDFLENGQWHNAGINAILGKDLNEGWNHLAIQRDAPVDGIKLRFQNGVGSSAEILEIAPLGSGVGPTWNPPDIDVSYPDAGQYYGEQAYIRGFVQPIDNGAGNVRVFVAGREVTRDDGAIEALVAKRDFTPEADGYSVTIDARYPDGTQATRKIYLTEAHVASVADAIMRTYGEDGKSHNGTNVEKNPGIAQSQDDPWRIEHDESVLELSPAALDKGESPRTIKIASLQQDDLPPLNPGMTNVTKGPRKGYRFNPHGKQFKKNIRVTIPYDEAKLPAGMTSQDIKTWYFDEELGRWVPLERVEVNTQNKTVISHTNHFTDMINATLTVPEHPQAASFNPTQIKDIKAADPGAGINLIEPPQPNNQGNANLSYPIEVPPGRNGMQPQLAIQYNSGGGNGWLGQGWDLPMQAITIDTRWGVPRYDGAKETETYLLSGEMLTPVAHRGELQPRTSEKTFHTRIEGQFRRIIRHGDNPKNYWWEVTDKNGTTFFYGGNPETNKPSENATLVDGKGNIGKWALTRIQDPNGNFVKYNYLHVSDSGIGDGTGGVQGDQLYLQEIQYTGHAGVDGPYRVKFIRDRELDEPRRSDVNIDARNGFKMVTADLLRRIEVEFDEQPVRSYELVYEPGAFNKTLLTTTIQYDDQGVEFNRHEFDYYDEVTTSDNHLALFEAPQDVNAHSDNIKDPLLGAVDYPTTLAGGSFGVNASANGFAGIGPPFIGKWVHAAVTVSANRSVSDSRVVLIDIDGDGLQDKVFERDGQVYFRRNISDVLTGMIAFAGEQPLPIQNLSKISHMRSSSWAKGVKANAWVFTGYASSSTTTTTDDVYFSDINGDGLVDQVTSGAVRFNYLNDSGVPAFTADSGETEVPIFGGAIDADTLLADMAGERAVMENENPLMDAIRRWQAPYSGKIKITGSLSLHNFRTDTSLPDEEQKKREEYESADGVRVAIQKNGTELWSLDITGEDYDSKALSLNSISVNKGDEIYFRVQSKYDGNYDRVDWAPEISYVDNSGNVLSKTDANQRNAYVFDAEKDFVLAGREVSVSMPHYGTVQLEGLLKKTGITSDDINVSVTLYEVTEESDGTITRQLINSASLNHTLNWDEIADYSLDHQIEVKKDQVLTLSVTSDSPVDLSKISWAQPGYPQVYYTYAYEPEHELYYPARDSDQSSDSELPDSADAVTPDPDDMTEYAGTQGQYEIPTTNEEGNPSIIVPVSVNTDIYSGNTLGDTPQQGWIADKDGVLLVTPWIRLKQHEEIECWPFRSKGYECQEGVWAPDGDITLTAKSNGRLLAKKIIRVENKHVLPGTQGYNALMLVPVKKGDEIFFDFSIKNSRLANEIQSSAARFAYGSSVAWKPPFSENVHFTSQFYANLPDEDDGSTMHRTIMMLVRNDSEIIYKKQLSLNGDSSVKEEYDLPIHKDENYYFDFFTISQDVNISGDSVWARYAGAPVYTVDTKGSINITPKLTFTNNTVDGNIELRVSLNGGGWHHQTYTVVDGVIPETSLVPISLDVNNNDKLRFEFVTHNHALSTAMANKGEFNIDYADETEWTVPESWAGSDGKVNLTIQPDLSLNGSASDLNGDITYRVWKDTVLLGEAQLTVVNGQVQYPDSLPINQEVLSGQTLKFAISSNNSALINAITQPRSLLSASSNTASIATVVNLTDISYPVQALHILMPHKFASHPAGPSERHFAIDHQLYGNPYHGWAFIGYYANPPYNTQPIQTARLRLKSESEMKNPESEDTVYLAVPSAEKQRWMNQDNNWWIQDGAMSSSRRGLDEIWVPEPADYQNSNTSIVVRTPRRSKARTFSAGGGAEYFTVNYSNGSSSGVLDLIDLNGDRYPDLVGSGYVQYSLPSGNMGETLDSLGGTNTSQDENLTFSAGPANEFVSTFGSRGEIEARGEKQPGAPDKKGLPISGSIGTGKSETEMQLNDINGDGLPDRIYQSGGDIYVQLNLGYEFAGKEKWDSARINKSLNRNISAFDLSYSVNGGNKQLRDMNGDGLADYVAIDNDKTVRVAFNTGAGFAAPVVIDGMISTSGNVPGVPGIPGFEPTKTLYDGASLSASKGTSFSSSFTIWAAFVPVLDVVWGGGVSVGATLSQPTIGFNDLNGDGNIDIFHSESDAEATAVINRTRYTNLLKSVRRPMGGRFEISYARKGNTYLLPQSRWVMNKVIMFDGVANDTPVPDRAVGSDFKVMTFDYEDGRYDRYEREFYGFTKVVTRELDTVNQHANDDKGVLSQAEIAALSSAEVYRRSTQTFLTDGYYTKGLLASSLMEGQVDGGNELKPFTGTANEYYLRNVDTGGEFRPESLPRLARATATVFPELRKTTQSFYEGGQGDISTVTEHRYDVWGNVIEFYDYGDTGPQDNVYAQLTYTADDGQCLANHIVGKARSIVVKNAANDAQWARKREGDFDCATGNLTVLRQYISDTEIAQTNLYYEANGNLQQIVGPENRTHQRLTLSYVYDSATDTYPVLITNESYGYSSTATYNHKFGKPLCTTDINGNSIAYAYDSVGRTRRIVGPYELPEGYACEAGKAAPQNRFTLRFTYTPYVDLSPEAVPFVSRARTEHYDRDAAGNAKDPIDTLLFADGLKQVLQTKKDASVYRGINQAPLEVMIVSGRTAMDPFGRSVRQYYPTTEAKGGSGGGNTDFLRNHDTSADPTVMTYDVLDRNLTTIIPDGSKTRIDYTISTFEGRNRFLTTVSDAIGNHKRSYRDVRELIVGVVEEGGITTRYDYDFLKQITRVTDDANHKTHVAYDRLGRRTVIDNPDTGRVETVYDTASNVIAKITPNLRKQDGNAAIHYDYDHSRLVQIRYPNFTENNVTYIYGNDTPETRAKNQVGRIVAVSHQAGTETREYGKLGEVVTESKTVTVASPGEGPIPTYVTRYDFDTFGRLMTLTLPDTEVLTHEYDSGGNVTRITGHYDGSDYAYLKRMDYDRFEQRRYMQLGNGVQTQYTYNPDHRRLCKLESGVTLSSNDSCVSLPRQPDGVKQALQQLPAAPRGQFQNLHYAYDRVGNILGTGNAIQVPAQNDLGGPAIQTFTYDNLYRLTSAGGSFTDSRSSEHQYTLAMSYDRIHNITHKTQEHRYLRNGSAGRIQRDTTYDWGYTYKDNSHPQPHAPTHIGNRTYRYDANGNQLGWDHDKNGQRRQIVWDEENHIQKIGDPSNTLIFAYDDQGQRMLKRGQHGQSVYVNQFFTVRNQALASKHVFAGNTRIATKVEPGAPVGTSPGNKTTTATSTVATSTVGRASSRDTTKAAGKPSLLDKVKAFFGFGNQDNGHPGQGVEHRSDRANEVAQNTNKNPHYTGVVPGNGKGVGGTPGSGNGGNNGNNGNGNGNAGGNNGNGNTGGNGGPKNPLDTGGSFLYFYHPDHLGSTSYVTDANAKIYEHIEYFPFGETWVEEATNTYQRVPYRYTSKELDEETGLYYYGARYYDPRTSVWESVDPILGSYLGGRSNGGVFSPSNLAFYSYVGLNPQKYIDPTGMAKICADDGEGNQSCVYVDANADGNSKDDDLSKSQVAMFSAAYKGYISNNNGRDIGGMGTTVTGGTKEDQENVRVASQFVGANLEGGWGNTRIEIGSQYRVGSYTIPVDLGKMDLRKTGKFEEYILHINMKNGDHRTNPSSIARTLTHESLHRGKGQYISGKTPSHRRLDDNAISLIKQWGLGGSGCPAGGGSTGFMGLWGAQFYSGC